MLIRRVVSYAAIIAAATVLSLEFHQWGEFRRHSALEDYRHVQDEDGKRAAATIEQAIDRIYQGIRMVAALPSIRSSVIDGGTIEDDGRFVIGHAFANYLSPASVARVYVVSMRADAARSGGAADALVVRALTSDGQRTIRDRGGRGTPAAATDQEFDLLAEQVARLRRAYPVRASAPALEPPMVGGREIGLGTGGESTKNGADRDGRGSIFSVPIYGADDRLSGAVAAVVRTSVLRRQLPSADHALINTENRYFIASPRDGMLTRHAARVAVPEPVPDIPFSSVYTLRTADDGGWKLWVAHSESDFYLSADFVSAELTEILGQILIWAFAIGSIAVLHVHHRKIGRINRDAELLAERIASLMNAGGVGRP